MIAAARASQNGVRALARQRPITHATPLALAKHTPLRSASLSQTFKRTYADASPPPPSAKPPKRKAGVLRWIGRLSLLAFLGSVGAVIYNVQVQRNPADQPPPDPKKKTLVILGTGWGSVSLIKSLDTSNYNVIVISPRNYFLFTPLLPSCTTGQIEIRSIMEPIRYILRHKKAAVRYYEAEATHIDHEKKVVQIADLSEIKGASRHTEIPFDMLVIGVGADNATFGIPGVREHSCFLKEVGDAQKIRRRIMDCIETSIFKDQPAEEVKRLLHMVVVGGGPTGIEFAGEMQDFFSNDLKKWIPDIKEDFKITLVEALPKVLPMFSQQLIDYTESTFKEEDISIYSKTMVKNVTDTYIEAEKTCADGSKELIRIPYGLLVWATGNTVRPIIRELMNNIPAQKESRRGLTVNEYMVVNGTSNIWAVGDCAISNYAPTAQVAGQEGAFLGRLFNSMAKAETIEEELQKLSAAQAEAKSPDERKRHLSRIRDLQRQLYKARQFGPFQYSHQGSLAYIGKERAVADISWLSGNIASGGTITYLFWRSAYLSMCFSTRNRVLVAFDWCKAQIFGRDISRK